MSSGHGDLVPTLAIKEGLEALGASEDRRHTLSDTALAAALRGRGRPVARRTVAKYREELRIQPSHRGKASPAHA